ncbi:MAG: gluconokinase, partial [Flavobacteriaceae bacterium]|nr:gluconokinase [Flavobacteriaceae bacterium]
MVYVLFGVSGSGKTTLGKSLADYLKEPFHDADDFHPPSNIEKMKSGIPLNDTDRYPWLHILGDEVVRKHKNGRA